MPEGGREDKEVPCAHCLIPFDTVYPVGEEMRNSFGWLAESDRIYGPGVNDNKGGTAMIWMVLEALRNIAPDVFERAANRLGIELLAEPQGGLSDGNYLSQFVPTLDELGPFGLHGHASERSADGSKLPEFLVVSSFLEMGAVSVAAIRELVSA